MNLIKAEFGRLLEKTADCNQTGKTEQDGIGLIEEVKRRATIFSVAIR